jgi:eukaryotic-like serine/threonine-protein kinase
MSGASADRNLLLGIIALQMDFISRDTLIAAMQAWVLNKATPLSQILKDQGDLTDSRQSLLDALVEEHLKLHQNEPQRSLAALSSIGSVREELSRIADPDVQASLPRLAAARQGPDSDPAGTVTATIVGGSTSAGTRFHIIRPHARGGLGEVFVARDTELNREVALKEIQVQFAFDTRYRSRFEFEAEVTGGLEHPGIVPVYGLGTYADGRPYYAMRFIQGDSLKEAIDGFHADKTHGGDPGRRSLELRKLLRCFTDVCNAIDYAHSRGVLHRDIKPSNIIVGRHGETLVVDWGLAKATGKSDPSAAERTLLPSSSGSSDTMPGSALGTPAYMSPEQAEGQLDRLGPRSDIYSLGATLYSVLTGKPPFSGEVADVIHGVQRGDFRPPRELDTGIDPALDAICLKAMAHRSEDRYDSCRALTDDLDRWMADEPVTAWREPLARRARRWARRNRTVVTAAVVALVAGVVGLSAVLAVQTQAKTDITRALGSEKRANTALAAANAELAHSQAAVQARYDLAVEAIEMVHTGVSEDFLLKQEQFKEVRNRLLKSASEFYGKLGALLGKVSDLASRRVVWQANYKVAALTATVGKPEDALAAHRQVLSAREVLAAEIPDDPEIKADVGRSLLAVAGLLHTIGRTGEAEATYRKAETLLVELVPMTAKGGAARVVLADVRSRLGWLLHTTGHDDQALSVYRLARADQEALAAGPGPTTISRRDLADTIVRVGILLASIGTSSEAESEFRKALALYRKLADDDPVVGFRYSLAMCYSNLGSTLANSGRSSDAEPELRKALVIQQKLAADNPAVTGIRSSLATSHSNLGNVLRNIGRLSEAEAEFRKALALQQKLADDNPAVIEFRSSLATSRLNLRNVLSYIGKSSDTVVEYRKALAVQQKLADDNPAVVRFQSDLARSHDSIGTRLSLTDDAAGALTAHRDALAIRQKLAATNPNVTAFQEDVAYSQNSIGGMLERTGDPVGALAAYGQALAIRQNVARANPGNTQSQLNLADTLQRMGSILVQSGKPGEATDYFSRELATQQKLADDNPASPQFRRNLADRLLQFGGRLAQAGKTDEAISYYTREEAIRRTFADASAATPGDMDSLANCQTNLTEAFRRSGKLDEALATCERALAVRERQVETHPDIAEYRADLGESYLRIGQVRFDMENLVGAATAWKRASAHYDGIKSLTADHTFIRACCHAGLAGLAGRPASGVTAAEGTDHAEKAMALLRQAVTMRFRSADAYRTESALDPLRNRPDFRALMMDLTMPADPFAHGR